MKKLNFTLLILLCSPIFFHSCVEVPSYQEPRQLINTDLARLFNSNYNETRHRLISSSIQREDANAAWYSLEELENYIHYIKIQGRNKGYNVSGIRFYLGAYPNTNEYGEKANLTTIFLSPTGNRLPTQKGNVINLPSATLLATENPDIEEINPLNFGTMGPPPRMVYPSN